MNSTLLITGTSLAPVSIETALRYCRISEADVDMVELLLQSATEKIEDYLGRSLVTKTFRYDLNNWPIGGGSLFPGSIGPILLPRTPALAVSHIKYYVGGVLTTWSSANYRLNTAHVPPMVEFAETVEFPSLDVREDAVQITFTSGYGDRPSDVPAVLRLAVLQLLHHWFDHRRAIDSSYSTAYSEIPMGLRSILRAYRVESTL